MKYDSVLIWHDMPEDIEKRLERTLDTALEISGPEIRVFFRADDVGVPGKQFEQLMALFLRHHVPLALAVVPAWLTRSRWDVISRMGNSDPALWCWHQHGWRHENHETEGKKQEFGPARSVTEIENDIVRGKDRLLSIMEDEFYPVFTPPWNRCSADTLEILRNLEFYAVSRFEKAKISALSGLPDIPMNVDLHTRKDPDAETGWAHLFTELETGLKHGLCGIMIHHQRMNKSAFVFLDLLLTRLNSRKIHLTSLPELVSEANS